MSCSCLGALLQEGVADLPIDMLLLEDVLICEVNLPVEVLKAGILAEEHELVVDEAILDVVELVDVVHNFLTFFFTKCWTKALKVHTRTRLVYALWCRGY
jgi:hypothetical protein